MKECRQYLLRASKDYEDQHTDYRLTLPSEAPLPILNS